MLNRQIIEKMIEEMGLSAADRIQFSQFENWTKMLSNNFSLKNQIFIEVSTTTESDVEAKGENKDGELGRSQ